MKKHSSQNLSDALAIYDDCKFIYSDVQSEKESAEYEAHTFIVNHLRVKYRTAKITPTKTGQFVTLWKRNENEPIMPFDAHDPIDLVVITVRCGKRFGQFVFPKSVLIKHKIISYSGTEGKRAMRVYPSWDKTTSSQANKTQKWQLEFFFEVSPDGEFDRDRLNSLYSAQVDNN